MVFYLSQALFQARLMCPEEFEDQNNVPFQRELEEGGEMVLKQIMEAIQNRDMSPLEDALEDKLFREFSAGLKEIEDVQTDVKVLATSLHRAFFILGGVRGDTLPPDGLMSMVGTCHFLPQKW